MEIFGKHIFGETLEYFIELSRDEKAQWIKKRTSQQNDDQINEFLDNFKPIKNNGSNCLDCGKLDNKIHNPNGGNISKGNEQEVATVDKPINDAEPRIGNSAKRPKKVKGAKN